MQKNKSTHIQIPEKLLITSTLHISTMILKIICQPIIEIDITLKKRSASQHRIPASEKQERNKARMKEAAEYTSQKTTPPYPHRTDINMASVDSNPKAYNWFEKSKKKGKTDKILLNLDKIKQKIVLTEQNDLRAQKKGQNRKNSFAKNPKQDLI